MLPQTPQPFRQKLKWLIFFIAAAAATAALLLAVFSAPAEKGEESLFVPMGSGSSSSARDASALEESAFLRYESQLVSFAFSYPRNYVLTEPNENNVLVTDEDDFRVVVEHTVSTTTNSFVYSAKDFAAQLNADPAVLPSWLGAAEVTVDSVREMTVAGTDGICYRWSLTVNGTPYIGALLLLDSQGDIGCYAFQWMRKQDCEKGELYDRQVEIMLSSFEITGPCRPEGYTVYHARDLGLRFVLREALPAGGTVEIGKERVTVFPFGGAPADTGIRIHKDTVYFPDRNDPEQVLRDRCSYYLKDKSSGKYLSDIKSPAFGRYAFQEMDLEYTEEGQRYVIYEIVFPCGDDYWEITLNAAGEELDDAAAVLWEIVGSLCLSEDAGGSQNDETPRYVPVADREG